MDQSYFFTKVLSTNNFLGIDYVLKSVHLKIHLYMIHCDVFFYNTRLDNIHIRPSRKQTSDIVLD